jgi:hypothetical protein
MAEEQSPDLGGGSAVGPWVVGHPAPSASRTRTWPAMAVAVVGVLLGAAGLIVALTRPTPEPVKSTAPTYTAAEIAAAHQKLCDAYKLAARAVAVDTHGNNSERANIATVNGALILEEATVGNAAIAPGDRTTALALAESYSNAAAITSVVTGTEDPMWQSALHDVNAKDAELNKVCGGG